MWVRKAMAMELLALKFMWWGGGGEGEDHKNYEKSRGDATL